MCLLFGAPGAGLFGSSGGPALKDILVDAHGLQVRSVLKISIQKIKFEDILLFLRRVQVCWEWSKALP